jgi:hypothetical protein
MDIVSALSITARIINAIHISGEGWLRVEITQVFNAACERDCPRCQGKNPQRTGQGQVDKQSPHGTAPLIKMTYILASELDQSAVTLSRTHGKSQILSASALRITRDEIVPEPSFSL